MNNKFDPLENQKLINKIVADKKHDLHPSDAGAIYGVLITQSLAEIGFDADGLLKGDWGYVFDAGVSKQTVEEYFSEDLGLCLDSLLVLASFDEFNANLDGQLPTIDLRETLTLQVEEDGENDIYITDHVSGDMPMSPFDSDIPYRNGIICRDQHDRLIELTADMAPDDLVAAFYNEEQAQVTKTVELTIEELEALHQYTVLISTIPEMNEQWYETEGEMLSDAKLSALGDKLKLASNQ